MKKMISMLLAGLLLFSGTVCAAVMDKTLLQQETKKQVVKINMETEKTEKGKTVKVNKDTEKKFTVTTERDGDDAFVESEVTRTQLAFTSGRVMDGYHANTRFDILVHDYKKSSPIPVMRLWILFAEKENRDYNRAVFTVSGTDYTFSEVGDTKTEIEEGGYYHYMLILFDSSNQKFLDAIGATGNTAIKLSPSAVKMVLKGDKEGETLEATIKSTRDFYTDARIIYKVFDQIKGKGFLSSVDGSPMRQSKTVRKTSSLYFKSKTALGKNVENNDGKASFRVPVYIKSDSPEIKEVTLTVWGEDSAKAKVKQKDNSTEVKISKKVTQAEWNKKEISSGTVKLDNREKIEKIHVCITKVTYKDGTVVEYSVDEAKEDSELYHVFNYTPN